QAPYRTPAVWDCRPRRLPAAGSPPVLGGGGVRVVALASVVIGVSWVSLLRSDAEGNTCHALQSAPWQESPSTGLHQPTEPPTLTLRVRTPTSALSACRAPWLRPQRRVWSARQGARDAMP